MSTLKRFNTSNSRDYNNDQAHVEGTLTWDTDSGLCLHDGETPGGDPIIGIHEQGNVVATVTGGDSVSIVTVTGDQTGQWWATVNGSNLYFSNDPTEVSYRVSAKSYDSGSNLTSLTFSTEFNPDYIPQVGTTIYADIYKRPVNHLIAGRGVNFDRTNKSIIVEQQYAGQQNILLDAGTAASGYTITELTCALIGISTHPEYGNTGETHDIVLPFENPPEGIRPDIPLGTRITVINNQMANSVNIYGWAFPGYWTLNAYESMEMIYMNDVEFGAQGWWVTNTWVWP